MSLKESLDALAIEVYTVEIGVDVLVVPRQASKVCSGRELSEFGSKAT